MRAISNRRSKGSVVALAFVGMVPVIGAIGGFAVDVMHVNAERHALQRATDAAALAGANDLSSWTGTTTESNDLISGSNEELVNYALQVSQANVVDGRAARTTGGTSDDIKAAAVVITGSPPSYTITTCTGPSTKANGCMVTGSMKIRSLLLTIFGNFFGSAPTGFGTTITTSSVARGDQLSDKFNSYMPILVSSTQAGPSGILSTLPTGAPFTVEIKTNAVWIFNPNPDDIAGIQHAADPSTYPLPPAMTPITIDDTINSDNGVKSAGGQFGLVSGKTVIFPVTADSVGTGPPSHKVIGFFALKISSVVTSNPSPSLTGTLVQIPGGTYSGRGQDPIFTAYPSAAGSSPVVVKLIQ